MEIRSPNPGA